MNDEIPTKICNVCGQEKPITDFAYAYSETDMRSNECNLCHNEKAKRRKAQRKAIPMPWYLR